MPPYNSSNLQAGIGRDVFYPALGFFLSELTGNVVYRDGAAATPTNADGTPYGAIPYANSRLGTGSVPDLTYPAPTAMQDSAYTAGYGRGVIFARSAQHRADPLAACDQWWDFGNNPALAGSYPTYSVRQPTLPTSAFPLNDGNLDDPFAHYAGREIVAARQLGHPKRLGLVAQAVLFLARQERTYHPNDPSRPLNLWAALWAGNPPKQLDPSAISCIPIT